MTLAVDELDAVAVEDDADEEIVVVLEDWERRESPGVIDRDWPEVRMLSESLVSRGLLGAESI